MALPTWPTIVGVATEEQYGTLSVGIFVLSSAHAVQQLVRSQLGPLQI